MKIHVSPKWGEEVVCEGTEMRMLQPYMIYPLPIIGLPAQICPGAGAGTEKRYCRKKRFCPSQIVSSFWPNQQALGTFLIPPSSKTIQDKGKFSFTFTQDGIFKLCFFSVVGNY